MKKTGLWLSVVVGLQVAWMIGTAISKEANLARGAVVLLETAPVDPRDLLRGDYVILSYKISSLPASWVGAEEPGKDLGSQTVYVALEKRGNFHEAIAASLEPITPTPGTIVARGALDGGRFRGQTAIRVRYGIEKYFVKEGTGNPRGALTVQCVVSPDGTMLIKEVYLDGKPYAEAMGEAAQ